MIICISMRSRVSPRLISHGEPAIELWETLASMANIREGGAFPSQEHRGRGSTASNHIRMYIKKAIRVRDTLPSCSKAVHSKGPWDIYD